MVPSPGTTVVVKTQVYRVLDMALFCILLIVVPWAITILAANKPRPADGSYAASTYSNSKNFDAKDAAEVNRLTIAANILTVFSALVTLPVIYALLARAAVVYSQRTGAKQSLNVRQLFSLADRRFVRDSWSYAKNGGTGLARLGALLIALAFATPIVRFSLVDSLTETAPPVFGEKKVGSYPPLASVARLPTRNDVLALTRNAMASKKLRGIGVPNDENFRVWGDPQTGDPFATTIALGTNTGFRRQHVMGLSSTRNCVTMTNDSTGNDDSRSEDFDAQLEQCWQMGSVFKWDWNVDNNLTVRICAPQNPAASPWRSPATEINYPRWDGEPDMKRLRATETVYFNMSYGEFSQYDSRSRVKVKCTVDTSLGWFELANEYNGLSHGPLLEDVDKSIRGRAHLTRNSDNYDQEISYDDRKSYGDPPVSPGPLGIVLLSRFGPDSAMTRLRTYANESATTNTTASEHAQLAMCQGVMAQMPRLFQSTHQDNFCSNNADVPGTGWGKEAVAEAVASLAWTGTHPNRDPYWSSYLPESLLAANQALLDVATRWPTSSHYAVSSTTDHVTYRRPGVSQSALIAISVLVGLQAAGVLALACYILWVPVWTETLDALAVARIAHRLKDDGYIRRLGLRFVKRSHLRDHSGLHNVDAMVGVVESRELGPVGPPPAQPPVVEPPPAFMASSHHNNPIPLHPRTLPGDDDVSSLARTSADAPSFAREQGLGPPAGIGMAMADEEASAASGEPPAYTPRRSGQHGGGNGARASATGFAPPPYANDGGASTLLDVGGPGLIRRGVEDVVLSGRRRMGGDGNV